MSESWQGTKERGKPCMCDLSTGKGSLSRALLSTYTVVCSRTIGPFPGVRYQKAEQRAISTDYFKQG